VRELSTYCYGQRVGSLGKFVGVPQVHMKQACQLQNTNPECVCANACVFVHVCVRVHVCMCVFFYVCVHVCVFMCACVCLRVCICSVEGIKNLVGYTKKCTPILWANGTLPVSVFFFTATSIVSDRGNIP